MVNGSKRASLKIIPFIKIIFVSYCIFLRDGFTFVLVLIATL